MMLRILKIVSLFFLLFGLVGGCATYLPDNRADYKKTETLSPLEVPPDLTLSTNDELILPNEVTKATSNPSTGSPEKTVTPVVSLTPKKIEVRRDNRIRWLLVRDDSPESLWPKVRTFWLEQGFQFTLEDPKIGILETDWQENRADIPQTGLRKLLGGVFDALHSAPTRDKFRTRLERGIDGTELYLTHRGAEEVSTGDTFQWRPRAADPELEAEMLNRLMVFLGVETDTANALLATPTLTSSSQVELVQTGTVKELVISDDLGRAWQRVGVVLDQLGFGIEERRRSEGIYRVRYFGTEENKGFLARLFGSNETEEQLYQIHLLTEQEKKTRLRILDEQGQVATSKVAEQILTLLYERLK